VLLFAFGEDLPRNPYIPHNLPRNCVLYTGTHDNNTVKGWFEREATPESKERLFRYLGRQVLADRIRWEKAKTTTQASFHVEERMHNVPGLKQSTGSGNCDWNILTK